MCLPLHWILELWFHRFLGCLGYLGTARLRQHHRSTSARTVTSTTLRSFYIAIALSPYEPSLRSFPIETSHLSIAGPRHLCTLVILIYIAYHIILVYCISPCATRVLRIHNSYLDTRSIHMCPKKELKSFEAKETIQAKKQ